MQPTKNKNYYGKNPKKRKQKSMTRMCCPVCGATTKLVNGADMNFRMVTEKTTNTMYWRCSNYPNCNTYIAADPKTKRPSGIMGGPSLRHKRIVIHQWAELFSQAGKMDPSAFFQMCGSHIGIHCVRHVHTRNMTEMQCDTILKYLQSLYDNNKDIRDMVDAKPYTAVWKEVRGLHTETNHDDSFEQDGEISETSIQNAEKKSNCKVNEM